LLTKKFGMGPSSPPEADDFLCHVQKIFASLPGAKRQKYAEGRVSHLYSAQTCRVSRRHIPEQCQEKGCKNNAL
jgi:hypothetical protein